MPKTNYCQSKAAREKPLNNILLAEISRGMTIKGKQENDISVYAGFGKSCWYERRKRPGKFTLDELRRIFTSLGTSNEVILAVFGRENK